MTITCIALDDEPKALEVIKSHIAKVDYLCLLQSFTDPYKAISYLEDHPVDLIFLDIEMPDINGVKIARFLKKTPLIIFTTAHSEYALESYEVKAVDYLLKPFDFVRFLTAVSKAKEWLEKKALPPDDFFFVNVGYQKKRLAINDILFIQSEGNYVAYITSSEKIMVRSSIGEALANLPAHSFIQIYRSTVVSLKWIDKIEDHHVYIQQYRLQISATYKEAFYKKIDEKSGRSDYQAR